MIKAYIEGNRGWKTHLISAVLTFLTGFCITLLAMWEGITWEAFSDGTIVGIIFAGVRAGVKLLVEAFVASRQK